MPEITQNMTYAQAIAKADAIRLNTSTEAQKCEWVFKVDCDIAEMLGINFGDPAYPVCATTSTVLMDAPHDDIYYLYVIAMVDYYHEEIAMYNNDMALYNAALADAKAFYRRHHKPEGRQVWRTWTR